MAGFPGLRAALAAEMQAWEAAGLRRTLVPGAEEGLVDFVSNDYLGLSRHPAPIAAACAALETEGTGGRASRLLGGGSHDHEAAEEAIARWLGDEAALLFPSGYQANLGAITALVGRGDVILSDARNHASMIDAARLSRAQVRIHAHLNLTELEQGLRDSQGARRRLVITEGIFSMDGDAPDIEALLALCRSHDAWLLVDEAHSIGLLGEHGAGACQSTENLVRVVPAGKALGSAGGFVVGCSELREQLVNHARSFVFSTACTPALAAGLVASIEQAQLADAEREHVRQLGAGLASALGVAPPAGAILPFRAGDPRRALKLAAACRAAGLDVRAVRPPTVPEGESGLRIVLHASNTEAQCRRLAEVLGREPKAQSASPRAPCQELFVVGTDTDIGKTVVSALLVRSAARLGGAAYWKPVQTGDDSDSASVLRLAGPVPIEEPIWSLPLPASPHAAALAAGISIDSTRLDMALAGFRGAGRHERLVIELAGGLLVPYCIESGLETQADWLAREGAPLILVARSGLGTLNHTLLSLEALRARRLEPRALFLVGEPHASNRSSLARVSGIQHIYEVEHLEGLESSPTHSLDAWLDRHDLDPIWNHE